MNDFKSQNHEVLLSVESSFTKGTEKLSNFIKFLTTKSRIEKISAIYKIFKSSQLNEKKKDNNNFNETKLIVALKLNTIMDFNEFSETLFEYDIKSQDKKEIQIFLLGFDQLLEFDPRRTLPHPDLHLLPELLLPAAEVWPNYYHTILSKTLLEYAEGVKLNGTFFAQGHTLLDFSLPKP